jgi:hypothetical protein
MMSHMGGKGGASAPVTTHTTNNKSHNNIEKTTPITVAAVTPAVGQTFVTPWALGGDQMPQPRARARTTDGGGGAEDDHDPDDEEMQLNPATAAADSSPADEGEEEDEGDDEEEEALE